MDIELVLLGPEVIINLLFSNMASVVPLIFVSANNNGVSV